jgi:hypothetical protein
VPVDGAHSPHFNSGTFTLGTTEPYAGNTGYGVLGYTPGTLTDLSPAGPSFIYTISADNTVLQGQRIHGIVQINANNCTVQGCEIVGMAGIPYPGSGLYGLISNVAGKTGNVAQYNTLTQWDASTSTDNSIWWMVGVIAGSGGMTSYRNDISNINDAHYLTGGTHQILGNYVHDLGFRNDDSDQSGNGAHPFWSHDDGVQVMGGTNHVIDGNSFVMNFSDQTGMNRTGGSNGNPNPDRYAEQQWPNCHGVLMQNANNAITGVQITRNWFKYGTIGPFFTFAAGDTVPGGAHALTGNRFTPDQGTQFSQYIQMAVDPTADWGTITVDSSNVYSHDPDTPASAQGTPLLAPTGTTTKLWAYNISAHTP